MSFQNLINSKQYKILGLAMNYPSKTLQQRTKDPIYFSKTLNTLCTNKDIIQLKAFQSINYEIELGVQLGSDQTIASYFLCLDLTSSKIPEFRQSGKSYCLCKNLDNYLPVSDMIGNKFDWKKFKLELIVNDSIIIQGNCKDMFYGVEEQIQYASKFMKWQEGDLLLTGTPGIEPLNHGDQVEAKLLYDGDIKAKIKTQFQITEYIQQ